MDTQGMIRPTGTRIRQRGQRTEAFERMRYLGMQRRCGLLVGPRGSGKTEMLEQLEQAFQREGCSVAQIALVGMTGTELPLQVAAHLGIGLELNGDLLTTWAMLQDYADAVRQTGTKQVLIFDQLDRADDSLRPPLERILTLFDGTCSCLFAGRPKLSRWLRTLVKNYCWMCVNLQPLSETDVSQTFAQEVSNFSGDLQITPEAVATAYEVTAGRLHQLRRLAELARLAAEAENLQQIDGEVIRQLNRELEFQR